MGILDFIKKLLATITGNNKLLFKYAIQKLAGAEFKKRPNMALAFYRAINSAFGAVTTETTAAQLIEMVKNKLNVASLDKADRELADALLEGVSKQFEDYIKIDGLVASMQQYNAAAELLGWIKEMAEA